MEDKKVIPSMQEAKVRINNFDEVEHVYTDEEALNAYKNLGENDVITIKRENKEDEKEL